MSLHDAQAFAHSLAATLVVTIIVFHAGDSSHSAIPTKEYDGDADAILYEIDPLAL